MKLGAMVAAIALFVLPPALLAATPGTPGLAAAIPALLAPADAQPLVDAGRVAVIDARPLPAFMEGHLPGAESLTPDNVRSTREGVPAEIDPPDVLRTLAGRLGLDPARPVLVYSGGPDPDATLIAVVLRRAGFRQVAILDGGIARWKAENRPVTTARAHVALTKPALSADESVLVPYAAVRAAVDKGTAVIVDARPTEQYEKAHIKGAVSFPLARDFAGKDEPGAGSWKSPDLLRDAYRAVGVTPGKPVYVYCNTGHMASSVFYTLRYVLGVEAQLYDGSFSEWSTMPGAPIESKAAEAPAAETAKP